MEAKIIVPDLGGYHNQDLQASAQRLTKAGSYRDLSTVIITPVIGDIPPTIVQSWVSLIKPMNQKVVGPIFIENMEVGAAYTAAVELILGNPELSTYKYMLTLETDNMPPPDGLIKLYESIEGQVNGKKYDICSGLYWTKGETAMPMIYGDPKVMPKNFIPQIPIPETVQDCNGTGMGFSLFRLSMFKDDRLPKPWFQTRQHHDPQKGTQVYTQDLFMMEQATRFGYKICSDNRVRVGHRDKNTGIIW